MTNHDQSWIEAGLLLEQCLELGRFELRKTDTGYAVYLATIGVKAAEAETLPLAIAILARKLHEN